MKVLKPGSYIRLEKWNDITWAMFDTVQHVGHPGDVERCIAEGCDPAYSIFIPKVIIEDSVAFTNKQRAYVNAAVTLYVGEIIAVEGEQGIYEVQVDPEHLIHPAGSKPIRFRLISGIRTTKPTERLQ
jgi:hypothetical protein